MVTILRNLVNFGNYLNQLQRFSRQFRSVWEVEGHRGISRRVRSKLARQLAGNEAKMEVFREDVLALDFSHCHSHTVPSIAENEPIRLNWIVTPTRLGSGGHTTVYRIINYLELHGYQNRIYFYDVYGGDQAYYEDIVRSYYGFNGPVSSVASGMEDAHGVFATLWPTAYPAMISKCAGKRFYFVQDYEPYFYPVGSNSVLAENTYRMGFHGVTAGRWLAMKMREDFKMPAGYFDFGCDTMVYSRNPKAKRDGIVFYARPGAARRGFELGLMAIEAFARRCPDSKIHFYGSKVGSLPFSFIDHGPVTPSELNTIYNQCYAGLSLSLTNVSLVPHEMLAAGCIPVVNEAEHNRLVLDNEYVRFAEPNPHALASELEEIVTMKEFDSHSTSAAASVHSVSWDDAGRQVNTILRQALMAPPSDVHASKHQDGLS